MMGSNPLNRSGGIALRNAPTCTPNIRPCGMTGSTGMGLAAEYVDVLALLNTAGLNIGVGSGEGTDEALLEEAGSFVASTVGADAGIFFSTTSFPGAGSIFARLLFAAIGCCVLSGRADCSVLAGILELSGVDCCTLLGSLLSLSLFPDSILSGFDSCTGLSATMVGLFSIALSTRFRGWYLSE